ncbi:hypothetical protein Tco_1317680 [Tanacetum coccineum]
MRGGDSGCRARGGGDGRWEYGLGAAGGMGVGSSRGGGRMWELGSSARRVLGKGVRGWRLGSGKVWGVMVLVRGRGGGAWVQEGVSQAQWACPWPARGWRPGLGWGLMVGIVAWLGLVVVGGEGRLRGLVEVGCLLGGGSFLLGYGWWGGVLVSVKWWWCCLLIYVRLLWGAPVEEHGGLVKDVVGWMLVGGGGTGEIRGGGGCDASLLEMICGGIFVSGGVVAAGGAQLAGHNLDGGGGHVCFYLMARRCDYGGGGRWGFGVVCVTCGVSVKGAVEDLCARIGLENGVVDGGKGGVWVVFDVFAAKKVDVNQGIMDHRVGVFGKGGGQGRGVGSAGNGGGFGGCGTGGDKVMAEWKERGLWGRGIAAHLGGWGWGGGEGQVEAGLFDGGGIVKNPLIIEGGVVRSVVVGDSMLFCGGGGWVLAFCGWCGAVVGALLFTVNLGFDGPVLPLIDLWGSVRVLSNGGRARRGMGGPAPSTTPGTRACAVGECVVCLYRENLCLKGVFSGSTGGIERSAEVRIRVLGGLGTAYLCVNGMVCVLVRYVMCITVGIRDWLVIGEY